MKFDYNCEVKHLNVYKLSHKNSNGKSYVFQKKIKGKLFYKRFHRQEDAISFSRKVNTSLKKNINNTIKKYLK